MKEPNNLHEENEYTDGLFPYQMYRVNRDGITPPGRGYRDLHWHEELQFTLITRGEVSIQVNGDMYHLSAGEAIFINSGLLHITDYISDDGEYVSFNFPDKLLSFFAGSRMEQSYVLPFTTNYTLPVTTFHKDLGWHREILEYLWELEALMQDRSAFGWEYLISLKTNSMWYVLTKNLSNSVIRTPKNFIRKQQRMQMLINYIHEHYHENITLGDIALSAHISTGECCRCFKSLLHVTPTEYLCNYRIDKSIDLLNNTNYSVTVIAGMVGFNYLSNYIQHFKNRIGKTPGEYRTNKQ